MMPIHFHLISRFRRLALVALICGCAGVSAFDLQGHRGARGLAPENTLAAFERALDIGVTTLELDVGITADGVVVIAHDPALNPSITRDATGQWLPAKGPLIHSLSLAQLQAFDVGRTNPASNYARQFPTQQARDGERLPTLAALFLLVKARGADAVRFNIETKLNPMNPQDTASPEEFVSRVLPLIEQSGMASRVTLQSFDWRTLQLAQQRMPSLPTAYLSIQGNNFDNIRNLGWTAGLRMEDHGHSVARMVKAAGGAVWSPFFNNLTGEAVRQAQALGLKVIPWTVNSSSDMQRLMDWGVDGLITDYPDQVRELMRARGLPLPAAFPKKDG